MNQILAINKPMGMSPGVVIEKLQLLKPEYQGVKIGVAGRLDPMAEGLMLLMVGEGTSQRETLLKLSKEYTFGMITGIETDTYDLLGKITSTSDPISESETVKAGLGMTGTLHLAYPPFSSKTVKGVPLWQLAKKGILVARDIPEREMTVTKITYLEKIQLTPLEFKTSIIEKINLVTGDFRQEEILQDWDRYFKNVSRKSIEVFRFSITCASGTYVRALVHAIGKKIGGGATTESILRTKIGDYTLSQAKII